MLLLTDHVTCPVINTELRLFTSGFVVERIEKLFMPAIVAFAPHISHVCTVDMSACYTLAAKNRIPGMEQLSADSKFDGMLIIFTMKPHGAESPRSPRSPRGKSMEQCMKFNPMDSLLLGTQSTQHIAMFLPADTRSMEAVQAMRSTWRAAFRMLDIAETLGDTPEYPIPMSIVKSLLIVTDTLNMHAEEAVTSSDINPVQVPGAGYGAMRGFYNSSEWHRVHSKVNSREQAEEKVPLEALHHKTILVCGHAGSGALAVAEHVKQQLSSTCNILPVAISFNQRNFFDQIESICNDLRRRKLSPDTLIMLTALTFPTPYYPMDMVIDCLRSLFTVVYNIAVLCPSSVPQNKRYYITSYIFSGIVITDRDEGVSHELWTALVHDVALASNTSNLAIIMESECTQRDDYLLQPLDNSTVLRCSPHNIWFDADMIESIRDAMQYERAFTQIQLHPSPRISQAFPTTFPSIKSQTIAPVEGTKWDLEYLLMFFNAAFPQAVVASTVIANSWSAPSSALNKRGMQRAIELAKGKAYFVRRSEEGKALFGKILQTAHDIMEEIKRGMMSVQGVIEVSGCSCLRISVEACRNFIIIRPSSASACNLMISTDMRSDVLERTKIILGACFPHELKPRPMLHYSQLTEKNLKEIQRKYQHVELPAGWWYDGYSYLDLHGNKSTQRPDIDALCEMYIRNENDRIAEYNALMNECKHLCE